jgi:hypothetical protein
MAYPTKKSNTAVGGTQEKGKSRARRGARGDESVLVTATTPPQKGGGLLEDAGRRHHVTEIPRSLSRCGTQVRHDHTGAIAGALQCCSCYSILLIRMSVLQGFIVLITLFTNTRDMLPY